MNSEIIVAIITAIIGPIIVTISVRKFISGNRLEDTEQQDILAYGKEVAIRTCDGRYVMSDLNNNEVLVAQEEHVEAWEEFKIVHPTFPFQSIPKKWIRYGDKVAFRAKNSKKFVGADLKGTGELTARVPHVKDYEIFTLLRPSNQTGNRRGKRVYYGSFFALRAFKEEGYKNTITLCASG